MPEESSLLNRDEIATFILKCREWDNIPWRHQGRSRLGVDCVGLFAAVAGEMGKPQVIPNNYHRDPDGKLLLAELRRRFQEIKVKDVQVGDLVVMRFENLQGVPTNRHIALRTDRGIIHSAAMYRKVCEHTFDDEWERRTEHAFRMWKGPDGSN